MTRFISSRPEENEDPFVLDDLVPTELELICALLYNVRLGTKSQYKVAATNLLNKIESYMNDSQFAEHAADNVDMEVIVLNAAGSVIATLGRDNFEIDV